MIEQHYQETCKCCFGSGVQVLLTGERIICQACGGTGKKWVSNFDHLPPGIYCGVPIVEFYTRTDLNTTGGFF